MALAVLEQVFRGGAFAFEIVQGDGLLQADVIDRPDGTITGTIRDRPRFPMPALGREPYVRLPKPTTVTGRTADESSHSAAYSLNVGNLHNIGHSVGATPAVRDFLTDRQLRVGCRPSPVTNAAVQAEYRVNGSNQRDTGHWIWSAPPAAMADEETVAQYRLRRIKSTPSLFQATLCDHQARCRLILSNG